MKKENEAHLQSVREEYDRWTDHQYERENKLRSEIHDMLHHSEGFYVSGFWYWIHLAFFWTGVFVTIVFIVYGIIKAVG